MKKKIIIKILDRTSRPPKIYDDIFPEANANIVENEVALMGLLNLHIGQTKSQVTTAAFLKTNPEHG